jgi:uncharacterized repeat protein (TIGR03803 family)
MRTTLSLIGILVAQSAFGEAVLTKILHFNGTNGAQPQAGLTLCRDGNFVGTAEIGGVTFLQEEDFGTAFKVSPAGKIVWSFSFQYRNGGAPQSQLLRSSDGSIYGTTFRGGLHTNEYGYRDLGTVFRMSSGGRMLWSFSFRGTNGANPKGALMEGRDGNIYGTTSTGGKYGCGTVFRISRWGRHTLLYSFTGGPDGAIPVTGVVRGKDGMFYGTTLHGGLISTASQEWPSYSGYGTVFKMDSKGSLITLYSFGAMTNSFGRNLDGAFVLGELTLGKDGCFYGTTRRGGPEDFGTVFRISDEGVLTTLHSFTNIDEGTDPSCRLLLSRDGYFYGTTLMGGTKRSNGFGYGTVFRIGIDGSFKSIASFDGMDGAFPLAGLTQRTSTSYYGTTAGGADSPGTVFKLNITKPVLVIRNRRYLDEITRQAVVVTGKTKSRAAVAGVLYQVNDGAWTKAVSSDNWTNWTATAVLQSGKNIIRACAVDTAGDFSRTNRVKLPRR